MRRLRAGWKPLHASETSAERYSVTGDLIVLSSITMEHPPITGSADLGGSVKSEHLPVPVQGYPVTKSRFLKDVFVCSLGAFGGPEAHISVFLDVLVVKQD